MAVAGAKKFWLLGSSFGARRPPCFKGQKCAQCARDATNQSPRTTFDGKGLMWKHASGNRKRTGCFLHKNLPKSPVVALKPPTCNMRRRFFSATAHAILMPRHHRGLLPVLAWSSCGTADIRKTLCSQLVLFEKKNTAAPNTMSMCLTSGECSCSRLHY